MTALALQQFLLQQQTPYDNNVEVSITLFPTSVFLDGNHAVPQLPYRPPSLS
jgi:hypothetical protein